MLSPCVPSVQLLLASLHYLAPAAAVISRCWPKQMKADPFILNADGTRFICRNSKLSRGHAGNIIGQRALILCIVGHEKKSRLNVQQHIGKQTAFSSPRIFISNSADLSVASLKSRAGLFFCRTYSSIQIVKNLLKAFAEDREWVPRNISCITIFPRFGSYTGLLHLCVLYGGEHMLSANTSCITGEVSTR